MVGPAPSAGAYLAPSLRADSEAAERRTVGRVAGVTSLMAALVALGTLQLLNPHGVPSSFLPVAAVSLCTSVAFFFVRWDRLSPHWLHAIPIIATVETAAGIRLAEVYDDIAANYYLFIGLFAGYAFSSRRAVAAHVAFAAAASALPLLYDTPQGSETAARTVVGVLLLVVVTAIVTVLREGLQKRQRELQELAARDPLTGVGNYRLMSERLDYELARHRRSGASLTVMLLDLDGFKEINDSLGHLTGDRVLVEVAAALARSVRAQDTVARQGGDEFSILAPDTGDEQARRLATRVQNAVADVTSGRLSTSVGWVTFPADAQDAGALLALADAELRRTKRERGAGRDGREALARGVVPLIVEQSIR